MLIWLILLALLSLLAPSTDVDLLRPFVILLVILLLTIDHIIASCNHQYSKIQKRSITSFQHIVLNEFLFSGFV